MGYVDFIKEGEVVKDQTLGITSEVVEPRTRFPSPLPFQAFWIVTAVLVGSYSALVLGICAPIKVAARISGGRTSTLFILGIFTSELKITGSGVICTLPGGTE